MSEAAIVRLAREADTAGLTALLATAEISEVVGAMVRMSDVDAAVVFRLLDRDRAMAVFEALGPVYQQQILDALRDDRVVSLIEELDPDDRVRLLDEMPAKVANRLLASLSPDEHALTTVLLGYPEESAGRLMSPEFISLRAAMSAGEALAKIRGEGLDAETIYALPVLDDHRHLVGISGLRSVVLAGPDALVGDLMTTEVRRVHTDDDQEVAARLVREVGLIALPVVDTEDRLVGVITVDDAMEILEAEETEDAALHAGQQPSTAVVRALAIGDVRPSDLSRVIRRELRVGALLGLMLAVVAFLPVALIWQADLALVVSATILVICTWATVAGTGLPFLARRLGIDPAVVSAPMITTLVDATGLLIYFGFAHLILDF